MEFKIDMFEGPLDLLLHLIKENKMDIFDIPVVEITNQYLEYVHSLEDKNLEVASSYLVMASELVELKARMLLPRQEKIVEEDDEDPRDNLVQRLLEYQAYKEISKTLKEQEAKRKEVYTKPPESFDQYQQDDYQMENCGSLDNLVEAFKLFLARQKEEVPLQTKVTMKEITVSSRKIEIRNLLKKEKRVQFFSLFPVVSKEYIVATFLAILEMARSKELVIEQEGLFSEIFCEVI